jgi:hypothetical protein
MQWNDGVGAHCRPSRAGCYRGRFALMSIRRLTLKVGWPSAPMTKADTDGLGLLPNRALGSLQGFCDLSGGCF